MPMTINRQAIVSGAYQTQRAFLAFQTIAEANAYQSQHANLWTALKLAEHYASAGVTIPAADAAIIRAALR